METFKLRVKIGQHEFEAEGPEETVKAQFLEWKELIQSVPATVSPVRQAPERAPVAAAPRHSMDSLLASSQDDGSDRHQGTGISEADMAHVFAQDKDRRIVTLRVLPTGDNRHGDGLLLLLYGYRQLWNQH